LILLDRQQIVTASLQNLLHDLRLTSKSIHRDERQGFQKRLNALNFLAFPPHTFLRETQAAGRGVSS
jgi:hypothetical protein